MLELNSFSNYILKDISLKIEKGKDLIILGNNGAGKTTLAKVLSGIIESKAVLVDNKDISGLFAEDRTTVINYIPSKLEVFDEYLSVEEFLKLSSLHGKDSVETILKLLDISYLQTKHCKKLSSGESQMLLLASAVLHNADFTVFDEITANLDPKRQKKVFDILSKGSFLQSKIIITHNLNLAYKLGYDILYMQDGEIVFEGSNEKFFHEHNLEIFFGGSVKKQQDNIVVNL